MGSDRRFSRLVLAAVIVCVVIAAAGSTFVMVGPFSGFRGTPRGFADTQCSVPPLPESVVDVTLYDAGPSMMGSRPVMVGIGVLPDTVASGTISLLVHNGGGLVHELTVLRLTGEQAGALPNGPDGTAAEGNALGHAEVACGTGEGAGIPPGGTSWLTLELAPGRYELICNEPGHYRSGMYSVLTVT